MNSKAKIKGILSILLILIGVIDGSLVKLTYPKAFNSLTLDSRESISRTDIDLIERSGDARHQRANVNEVLIRRCGKTFTTYDPYTILAQDINLNITWDMTNYIKFGVSMEVWDQRNPWIVFSLTENHKLLPSPDTTSIEIKMPTELSCHPYCILKMSAVFPKNSELDPSQFQDQAGTSRESLRQGNFDISSSCARFIVVEDEAAMNCSNRGAYSKSPQGESKCLCDWLRSGKYCQYEDECYQASDCSGNGDCVDILKGFPADSHMMTPRGQCFCHDGWFGLKCRRRSMPQTINPANMAQARLGPGYQLFWKILKRTGEIEVIIMADTNSWVILGWSPKIRRGECVYKIDDHLSKLAATNSNETNQPNESEENRCYDMVFGAANGDKNRVFDWFSPGSSTFSLDDAAPDETFKFYAVRSPPGRDSLLDASTHEEDGVTFVYFKRKLRAYDMADIEIKNETMRVLWAKGRPLQNSVGGFSFMEADDIFMLRDLSTLDYGFTDINFIGDYENYLKGLENSNSTFERINNSPLPTTIYDRQKLSTEVLYETIRPHTTTSYVSPTQFQNTPTEPESVKTADCGITTFGYPESCKVESGNCAYHVKIMRDITVRNNGRTIVRFEISSFKNISDFALDREGKRIVPNDFSGILFTRDPERNSADVILAWRDPYSLPIISDMFTANQGTSLYMDTTQDIFEATLRNYQVPALAQSEYESDQSNNQTNAEGDDSRQVRKVVLSFSRLSDIETPSSTPRRTANNRNLSVQDQAKLDRTLQDVGISDVGIDDCFYFFKPSDRIYDPLKYLKQFGSRKNFTGSERENFYPYFEPVSLAPICLSACVPEIPSLVNFVNNNNPTNLGDTPASYRRDWRQRARVSGQSKAQQFDFPRRYIQGKDESTLSLKAHSDPAVKSNLLSSQDEDNATVKYITESEYKQLDANNTHLGNGQNGSKFLPANHYDSFHARGARLRVNGEFIDPAIKIHSADEFEEDKPQTIFCTHTPDPGPCFQYVPKWFFDQSTGSCIQFAYGGCRGSLNKFNSKDECLSICAAVIARINDRKKPNSASTTIFTIITKNTQASEGTESSDQGQTNDIYTDRQTIPNIIQTYRKLILGSSSTQTNPSSPDFIQNPSPNTILSEEITEKIYPEISNSSIFEASDFTSDFSSITTQSRNIIDKSTDALHDLKDTQNTVSYYVEGIKLDPSLYDSTAERSKKPDIEFIVNNTTLFAPVYTEKTLDPIGDNPNSASIVKIIDDYITHGDINGQGETNNRIRSAILSSLETGSSLPIPETNDKSITAGVSTIGDNSSSYPMQTEASRNYELHWKVRARVSQTPSTSDETETANYGSLNTQFQQSLQRSSLSDRISEHFHSESVPKITKEPIAEISFSSSSEFYINPLSHAEPNPEPISRDEFSTTYREYTPSSTREIITSSPENEINTEDVIDDIIDLVVTFKLTGEVWNENLSDRQTWDFRMMEWKIKAQIMDERKLREFPFFYRISDVAFREGSVIVDMGVETRFPRSADTTDEAAAQSIKEMTEIIPTALKNFILDSMISQKDSNQTSPNYIIDPNSIEIKVLKTDVAITSVTSEPPRATVLEKIKEQIANTRTTINSLHSQTPHYSTDVPSLHYSADNEHGRISLQTSAPDHSEVYPSHKPTDNELDSFKSINLQSTTFPLPVFISESSDIDESERDVILDFSTTLRSTTTMGKAEDLTSKTSIVYMKSSLYEELSPIEFLAKYSTEQAPRFVNPLTFTTTASHRPSTSVSTTQKPTPEPLIETIITDTTVSPSSQKPLPTEASFRTMPDIETSSQTYTKPEQDILVSLSSLSTTPQVVSSRTTQGPIRTTIEIMLGLVKGQQGEEPLKTRFSAKKELEGEGYVLVTNPNIFDMPHTAQIEELGTGTVKELIASKGTSSIALTTTTQASTTIEKTMTTTTPKQTEPPSTYYKISSISSTLSRSQTTKTTPTTPANTSYKKFSQTPPYAIGNDINPVRIPEPEVRARIGPNFYGQNFSVILQREGDDAELTSEILSKSGDRGQNDYFIELEPWKIRAIIIASCVSGSIVLVICLIFCRQLYLKRRRKHTRNLKLNYYAAPGGSVISALPTSDLDRTQNAKKGKQAKSQAPLPPSLPSQPGAAYHHRVNRPEAIVTPRQKVELDEPKPEVNGHLTHKDQSASSSKEASPAISLSLSGKSNDSKKRGEEENNHLKNMSSIDISDDEKRSSPGGSSSKSIQNRSDQSDLASYYYYSSNQGGDAVDQVKKIKKEKGKRSKKASKSESESPSSLNSNNSQSSPITTSTPKNLEEFVEMSISRDGLNHRQAF